MCVCVCVRVCACVHMCVCVHVHKWYHLHTLHILVYIVRVKWSALQDWHVVKLTIYMHMWTAYNNYTKSCEKGSANSAFTEDDSRSALSIEGLGTPDSHHLPAETVTQARMLCNSKCDTYYTVYLHINDRHIYVYK